MSSLTIRPFDSLDYDAVLALYAAAQPLGMHAPALDNNDACRYIATAPQSLEIIGYGAANGDKTSDLKLVIHPNWQRSGVATGLWERLCAAQASRGVAAFRPWVREENAAGIAWLEKQEFLQIDKDGPVRYELTNVNLSTFGTYAVMVAAKGIIITTLADEMARDPECLRKLYALYTAVEADVPRDGGEYVAAPLESFISKWSDPKIFQDGFFIAIKAGRYIGLSTVGPRTADPYFEEKNDLAQQGLTGVLTEYRRRGIAIALKMRTIDFARRRGYRQLWTNSSNPAMRALNRKMGFQTGPWLVYHKIINDQ